MANAATLDVLIQLNARSFTSSVRSTQSIYDRALGSMLGQTQRFETAVARLEKAKKSAFSGGFGLGVGGALGVAAVRGVGSAISGLIDLLGDAVDRANAMRDAVIAVMKPLGKQIQSSAEDLKYFNEYFADLIRITRDIPGTDVESLAKIGLVGAKMGTPADKLTDFTRAIGALSIAINDMPVDQMADQVARIIGAYGIGADQAIYFGSAIDKLADSAKTTAKDLMVVANRAAGSASALKLAPRDLLVFSTALKDAGVMSYAAGGVLNQFITSLAIPDKAEKFAEFLEVTNDQFNEMRRNSPGDIMIQVLSKLKGMGDAAPAALEKMGFSGKIGMPAMLKLASQVETIKKLRKIAEHELKTADHVQKSVNLNAQKFETQRKAMRAGFDNLYHVIGGQLSPALIALNEHITLLVRDMADGADKSEGFKKAMAALKEAVDVFFEALRDPQSSWELFVSGLEWAVAQAKVLFIELKEHALREFRELSERVSFNVLTGAISVADAPEAPPEITDPRQIEAWRHTSIGAESSELIAARERAEAAKASVAGKWRELRDRGAARRSVMENANVMDGVAASQGGRIPGGESVAKAVGAVGSSLSSALGLGGLGSLGARFVAGPMAGRFMEQKQQAAKEKAIADQQARMDGLLANVENARGPKEIKQAKKEVEEAIKESLAMMEGEEGDDLEESLKERLEAAVEGADFQTRKEEKFADLLRGADQTQLDLFRDKSLDRMFGEIQTRQVSALDPESFKDSIRDGINSTGDIQKEQLAAQRELIEIGFKQYDAFMEWAREFGELGSR